MRTRKIFYSTLMVSSLLVSAQNEINLTLGPVAAHPKTVFFNTDSDGSSELTIKTITVLDGVVKSDDERTIGGKAASLQGGSAVPYSDRAILFTEYILDYTTKQINGTNAYMIGLREMDPYKQYKFSPGESSSIVKGETSVPYSLSNIASVPGITKAEVTSMQAIIQELRTHEGASKQASTAQSSQPTLADIRQAFRTHAANQPHYDREKVVRDLNLPEEKQMIITRNKQISKDIGMAYKVYFYEKGKILKEDSVFYPDESDVLAPDVVYDVKRKREGMLLRLECKSLNEKDKKDRYYRYTYCDKTDKPRHYSFRLGNAKMSSFEPYRTFKLGDTLIHLTTKKLSMFDRAFESSVLINDTVKKLYPLNPSDTISAVNLTCGVNTGTQNYFGKDPAIFLNGGFGNYYIIGEQERQTKAEAGLVRADAPDATDEVYAITRVYVIQDYAVRKIYKVRVQNFSTKTSLTAYVGGDKTWSAYLVQMSVPVIFFFNDKGELTLKNADVANHSLAYVLSKQSYTTTIAGKPFLTYADKQGNVKLIALK